MAILGSTAKPGPSQEWFGLNSKNQHAILFTMPAGGPWVITEVGVWAAGKDSSPSAKVCLWSPGGTIIRESYAFLLSSRPFGQGQADLYQKPLSQTKEITGGTQIWAGWVRNASGSAQHPFNSGGSHVDHASASIPANISTSATHSGTLGVYIVYESANKAPTAPSRTAPLDGSIITDTTPTLDWNHNDPDGDPQAGFEVQVDNSSAFTSPDWTNTQNLSDSFTTVNVALARGTWYWRVRTKDAAGLWGPWSTTGHFTINRLPTTSATGAKPTGSGHTGTPLFEGTYADVDTSQTFSHYEIEVNTASSFGGTVMWDTGQVATNSTEKTNKKLSRTYAGSALNPGSTYYWRYRVWDGLEASAWSSTFSFTMAGPPSATKTSPVSSGLAHIHNLATDLAVWTTGGAHAKPRFTWTYSGSSGQAHRQIRVYSASSGGTLLADSGKQASSSTTYDTSWAGVYGTAYWWTIEVWDTNGLSSGESTRTAFKLRWAQAIYEFAVPGGSSSSQWAFASTTAGGGQKAFLFATATGAGGTGRSTWKTTIGTLTPAAYLNVMVRLAATVSGTNALVNAMTFTYTTFGMMPDRWIAEGTSPSDWVLDADMRRFGEKALKCSVSTTTGQRIVYPFRKTAGDDIPVLPDTDYVLTAYVRGDGMLTGAVSVRIYDTGNVLRTEWYTDSSQNATKGELDAAGEPKWVRVMLRYRTPANVTMIRPKIVYAGGAIETFWVDAVQNEAGNVASAWRPGMVSEATVLDVTGEQIDGSTGGIFRLRGTAGGVRDTIELGANGLLFGGDAQISSPVANVLRLPGTVSIEGVSRLRSLTGASALDVLTEAQAAQRVRAHSLTLSTSYSVTDAPAAGISFQGDTILSRTAANVLSMSAGDRLDQQIIGWIASRTTGLSIPNATWTRIGSYDNHLFDDTGITSHASGDTIINVAGMYDVLVTGEYSANATGNWRTMGIGKAAGASPTALGGFAGPGPWDTNLTPSAGAKRINGSWLVELNAGDRIAMFTYQDSGAAFTLNKCMFSVVRRGPIMRAI